MSRSIVIDPMAKEGEMIVEDTGFAVGPEVIEQKAEVKEVLEPISEEVIEVEAVAETDIEFPQTESREYTDVELKALEMGWIPPEDFKDPEKEPISAQSFIDAEPIYKEKRRMKKEADSQIKELSRVVEVLSDNMAKQQAKGYEKALKELNEKRITAFEDASVTGDYEQAKALDQEYLDTRDEFREFAGDNKVKEAKIGFNKDELERAEDQFWARNRSWYMKSDTPEQIIMNNKVKEYGPYIAEVSPELTATEWVQKIEDTIRAEFPKQFENPNRKRAATVSPAKANRVVTGPTYENLTDQQKDVFSRIKKMNPDYTVQEYLGNVSKRQVYLK